MGEQSPPPADALKPARYGVQDGDCIIDSFGGQHSFRVVPIMGQEPHEIVPAVVAALNQRVGAVVQSPPPIMGEGLPTDELSWLRLAADGPGTHASVRRSDVRAVVQWIDHRATPSLPDGMVMVPREPWQAMLNAADNYLESHGGAVPHGFRWHEVWDAMIATAPASALRMDKELK